MKINELLSHIKSVKPNPYSDEVLLNWINDCEAKILVEVKDVNPVTIERYDLPKDAERELFLPKPYDEVYSLYLQAYIDFQMQEYESYNNIMLMHNNALNEAKKFFVRNGERSAERIRVYL